MDQQKMDIPEEGDQQNDGCDNCNTNKGRCQFANLYDEALSMVDGLQRHVHHLRTKMRHLEDENVALTTQLNGSSHNTAGSSELGQLRLKYDKMTRREADWQRELIKWRREFQRKDTEIKTLRARLTEVEGQLAKGQTLDSHLRVTPSMSATNKTSLPAKELPVQREGTAVTVGHLQTDQRREGLPVDPRHLKRDDSLELSHEKQLNLQGVSSQPTDNVACLKGNKILDPDHTAHPNRQDKRPKVSINNDRQSSKESDIIDTKHAILHVEGQHTTSITKDICANKTDTSCGEIAKSTTIDSTSITKDLVELLGIHPKSNKEGCKQSILCVQTNVHVNSLKESNTSGANDVSSLPKNVLSSKTNTEDDLMNELFGFSGSDSPSGVDEDSTDLVNVDSKFQGDDGVVSVVPCASPQRSNETEADKKNNIGGAVGLPEHLQHNVPSSVARLDLMQLDLAGKGTLLKGHSKKQTSEYVASEQEREVSYRIEQVGKSKNCSNLRKSDTLLGSDVVISSCTDKENQKSKTEEKREKVKSSECAKSSNSRSHSTTKGTCCDKISDVKKAGVSGHIHDARTLNSHVQSRVDTSKKRKRKISREACKSEENQYNETSKLDNDNSVKTKIKKSSGSKLSSSDTSRKADKDKTTHTIRTINKPVDMSDFQRVKAYMDLANTIDANRKHFDKFGPDKLVKYVDDKSPTKAHDGKSLTKAHEDKLLTKVPDNKLPTKLRDDKLFTKVSDKSKVRNDKLPRNAHDKLPTKAPDNKLPTNAHDDKLLTKALDDTSPTKTLVVKSPTTLVESCKDTPFCNKKLTEDIASLKTGKTRQCIIPTLSYEFKDGRGEFLTTEHLQSVTPVNCYSPSITSVQDGEYDPFNPSINVNNRSMTPYPVNSYKVRKKLLVPKLNIEHVDKLDQGHQVERNVDKTYPKLHRSMSAPLDGGNYSVVHPPKLWGCYSTSRGAHNSNYKGPPIILPPMNQPPPPFNRSNNWNPSEHLSLHKNLASHQEQFVHPSHPGVNYSSNIQAQTGSCVKSTVIPDLAAIDLNKLGESLISNVRDALNSVNSLLSPNIVDNKDFPICASTPKYSPITNVQTMVAHSAANPVCQNVTQPKKIDVPMPSPLKKPPKMTTNLALSSDILCSLQLDSNCHKSLEKLNSIPSSTNKADSDKTRYTDVAVLSGKLKRKRKETNTGPKSILKKFKSIQDVDRESVAESSNDHHQQQLQQQKHSTDAHSDRKTTSLVNDSKPESAGLTVLMTDGSSEQTESSMISYATLKDETSVSSKDTGDKKSSTDWLKGNNKIAVSPNVEKQSSKIETSLVDSFMKTRSCFNVTSNRSTGNLSSNDSVAESKPSSDKSPRRCSLRRSSRKSPSKRTTTRESTLKQKDCSKVKSQISQHLGKSTNTVVGKINVKASRAKDLTERSRAGVAVKECSVIQPGVCNAVVGDSVCTTTTAAYEPETEDHGYVGCVKLAAQEDDLPVAAIPDASSIALDEILSVKDAASHGNDGAMGNYATGERSHGGFVTPEVSRHDQEEDEAAIAICNTLCQEMRSSMSDLEPEINTHTQTPMLIVQETTHIMEECSFIPTSIEIHESPAEICQVTSKLEVQHSASAECSKGTDPPEDCEMQAKPLLLETTDSKEDNHSEGGPDMTTKEVDLIQNNCIPECEVESSEINRKLPEIDSNTEHISQHDQKNKGIVINDDNTCMSSVIFPDSEMKEILNLDGDLKSATYDNKSKLTTIPRSTDGSNKTTVLNLECESKETKIVLDSMPTSESKERSPDVTPKEKAFVDDSLLKFSIISSSTQLGKDWDASNPTLDLSGDNWMDAISPSSSSTGACSYAETDQTGSFEVLPTETVEAKVLAVICTPSVQAEMPRNISKIIPTVREEATPARSGSVVALDIDKGKPHLSGSEEAEVSEIGDSVKSDNVSERNKNELEIDDGNECEILDQCATSTGESNVQGHSVVEDISHSKVGEELMKHSSLPLKITRPSLLLKTVQDKHSKESFPYQMPSMDLGYEDELMVKSVINILPNDMHTSMLSSEANAENICGIVDERETRKDFKSVQYGHKNLALSRKPFSIPELPSQIKSLEVPMETDTVCTKVISSVKCDDCLSTAENGILLQMEIKKEPDSETKDEGECSQKGLSSIAAVEDGTPDCIIVLSDEEESDQNSDSSCDTSSEDTDEESGDEDTGSTSETGSDDNLGSDDNSGSDDTSGSESESETTGKNNSEDTGKSSASDNNSSDEEQDSGEGASTQDSNESGSSTESSGTKSSSTGADVDNSSDSTSSVSDCYGNDERSESDHGSGDGKESSSGDDSNSEQNSVGSGQSHCEESNQESVKCEADSTATTYTCTELTLGKNSSDVDLGEQTSHCENQRSQQTGVDVAVSGTIVRSIAQPDLMDSGANLELLQHADDAIDLHLELSNDLDLSNISDGEINICRQNQRSGSRFEEQSHISPSREDGEIGGDYCRRTGLTRSPRSCTSQRNFKITRSPKSSRSEWSSQKENLHASQSSGRLSDDNARPKSSHHSHRQSRTRGLHMKYPEDKSLKERRRSPAKMPRSVEDDRYVHQSGNRVPGRDVGWHDTRKGYSHKSKRCRRR